MRHIVFDLETTGFKFSEGHRIVEIGAIELINGAVTGRSFHTYVDPQRDMPLGAYKVHGLSEDFLRGKPLFADAVAAPAFCEFVADAKLIAHNGAGFDLPVLHYRALLHGVQSPRYWETGDEDRSFRYNNYLSRFHWRHLDLMDVLAGFQNRARAPLDAVATMLGFPGKMGMAGDKVWDCFLGGGIREIRNYCETDVLNTYLVYLRFQHMRGHLDDTGLEREYSFVSDILAASEKAHLLEFLRVWQS